MGSYNSWSSSVPKTSTKEIKEDFVKHLLCFRTGWKTEETVKSDVDRIVREAKQCGRESNLQNLVTAVTSLGAEQTECCNVVRLHFDDWLIPHVICARIWRWPDVHRDELKHIDACKSGFDLKRNLICVNPYHYNRVKPVPKDSGETGKVTKPEDVSFETVQDCSAKRKDSESSSLTLNQTLPKDIFSLSCFQSALVAPSSSSVITVFGASSLDNFNDPSTSCNPNQAEISKTAPFESVLETSTSSQIESDIAQNSTVLIPIDRPSSANDDSDCSFKRSSSLNSDCGFEMINYEAEIEAVNCDAESSKAELMSFLTDSVQDTKNDSVGDETVTKADSVSTPLINDAENALGATGLCDQLELPCWVNHFLTGSSMPKSSEEHIPNQCASSLPDDNVEMVNSEQLACDSNEVEGRMEIENEDEERAKQFDRATSVFRQLIAPPSEIQVIEGLRSKSKKLEENHEKLKTAFIEVGYAIVHDTLAARAKTVQDVIAKVDDVFDDESSSKAQFHSLKSFVAKNSTGSCTTFKVSLPSASSTSAPYRQKNLTTAMRSTRKANAISLKTGSAPEVLDLITNPLHFVNEQQGRNSRSQQLLSSNKNYLSNELLQSETTSGAASDTAQQLGSNQHLPLVNDGDAEPSQDEDTAQGPLLIPRIVLKRLPSDKSVFVVQNSSSSNSCEQDSVNVAELQKELDQLRAQVKSLNIQLKLQKKDELEKMMMYTNNMREKHLNTVKKLNEEKNLLSAQLWEKKAMEQTVEPLDMREVSDLLDVKDREIEALNDNLLALSAILTSNEEELLALKKEKRKLKRNSDEEELSAEISSKRRHDSESNSDPNEDPLTPQHVFDYLCSQLEKSDLEKSVEESSPQKESTSGNNTKEYVQPALKSPLMKTLATSFSSCEISEREQKMAAKLNEMIAELEEMKITHVKTKSDLETRLKKVLNNTRNCS